MTVKTIAILISLVVFGILENVLPFFHYPERFDRRILPNLCLGVFNLVTTSSAIAVLLQWIWKQQIWPGLLSPIHFIGWRILIALLILDSYLYLWHRLMHCTQWGWVWHRIHHTETSMQVFTAYRFHTVEVFLSNLPKLLLIFLLGIDANSLIIYETLFAVSLIFHHSNFALPSIADRFLSYWIITPNYHRRHHSQITEEMNSNYGSLLSFWDHLFGTYCYPKSPETITLGVKGEITIHNPIQIWLQPFQHKMLQ